MIRWSTVRPCSGSVRPEASCVFRKILIANRGEIALRILRAAHELGIQTVVAYYEGDERSLPVMLADESISVGPGPAGGTDLNDRTHQCAATLTAQEQIHPGY